MNNCLNQKTLLLLHDGEGSAADRAHLDGCLNCARRYRQLTDDLKDIVAALRQPPPPQATRKPMMSAGLRWSLAAALVGFAFLVGRMTTTKTHADSVASSQPQSNTQIASAQRPAGVANVGATYGLYINNLIEGHDDSDQNQMAGDNNWGSDSDGF